MREEWIRKYMSGCTKEALIELYLQMRFERDMMTELYEEQKTMIEKNLDAIQHCGTCSNRKNCIKSDL